MRGQGVNIDDDSKFQNDQNVEILNFRGCFEAVRGRGGQIRGQLTCTFEGSPELAVIIAVSFSTITSAQNV